MKEEVNGMSKKEIIVSNVSEEHNNPPIAVDMTFCYLNKQTHEQPVHVSAFYV